MSLVTQAVCIFIGGGCGSLVRWSLSYLFGTWTMSTLPWQTILANIVSSAILGFLMVTVKSQPMIWALLGVGFCGGFSTFSTFTMESYLLLQQGFYATALFQIAISLVLAFSAFSLGVFFGR